MSDNGTHSTAEPVSSSRPRRVWWRVVMALLLIGGMSLGWLAMGRQKAEKQWEAERAVEQLGGRVYLDYQWDQGQPVEHGKPPQAAWLRRLLGPEMLDRAVAVNLQEVAQPDEAMRWLLLMPYLRYVDAAHTSLTDASTNFLRRMTAIEHLDLQGTRVTDAGVARLATLPRLRTLSLAGTALSDAGLARLAPCRTLRVLDLSGTDVSSAAVSRLQQALPKCRVRR